MRMAIGLLALTAACGDDGNMLPIGGGGNDGGFVFPDGSVVTDTGANSDSSTDATAASTDANVLDGRVCLLTDPRVLNQCATTGANGLTVRLGTATAVTGADGSFTILGQSGDLVWRVTGPNIVSSFEPLRDYFIPAMTTAMYASMKTANSVVEYPGEGAMMVFVSRNAVGVAGESAVTTPEGFYKPFYDGATATAWEQEPDVTGTGINGAVWVPGLDVGSATITVDGVGSTGPVFDGGITFANLLLP